MEYTFNVPPINTIDTDNKSFSQNFVPDNNVLDFNMVLPNNIPKNMAILAAPMLGTNKDKSLAIIVIKMHATTPGMIFFMFIESPLYKYTTTIYISKI